MTIDDTRFPSPPSGRDGWPWVVTSDALLPVLPDGHTWPKISIVTPSFNQGKFLEETIRSVLLQGYPNLEYVIIDGGSTDESVEIIRKYEPWLDYWVSEFDLGQAHALNKGFNRISGDWLAWINSDDLYLPDALFRVAAAATENPGIDWIVGTTVVVDCEFNVVERFVPCAGERWTDFVHVRQYGTNLPQPSSFWSNRARRDAGGLDESFHYAMDHDYWVKLAHAGYSPHCLNYELAAFRRHENAKTSEGLVPFWREELRVVDKWFPDAAPEERKTLAECRRFLKAGIARMVRRHLCSTIVNRLLAPLRLGNRSLKEAARYGRRLVYGVVHTYRLRYWENRARDIHHKWGRGVADYPVLRQVISMVNAKRILDFGCGSGRLFPLYIELGISEVVGQDVSQQALQIAAERCSSTRITLTSRILGEINFPHGYFDLIVCNRVLQHIPPGQMKKVAEQLAFMGKNLYVNELQESDDLAETFYMFRHDYRELFVHHGYDVISNGRIGKQTWFLFSRNDQVKD